jgi:hypothetical protein
VRRMGRPMTRIAALITPALLVAIVLLVHGTTPHGHRAAVPVISVQAWQATPAVSTSTPDGRTPDECPQPFDNCDAGVRTAAAPLSCADAQPLHRTVTGSAGDSALLAVISGAPRLRAGQARQSAEQAEPAHSQVYRC